MAFAKGRNEMRASIDDTASALVQLTKEMESYYNQKVSELSAQIDNVRKDNPNEDLEVLNCMTSSIFGIRDIYDEMHLETMEMLICKVYSFAEKHLGELLKRIPMTENKARKRLDGEGVSDIVKYYAVLHEKFNLSKSSVSEIWRDYEGFHTLRKNIVHHFDYEKKGINANYVLSNIEQAKELLLYVEEYSRVKE